MQKHTIQKFSVGDVEDPDLYINLHLAKSLKEQQDWLDEQDVQYNILVERGFDHYHNCWKVAVILESDHDTILLHKLRFPG